ncbi:L-serine ammonia-lyase, iron-sulfur-dependent subunit beta [Staphylococcus massiliensis]|uniref:L-serine deaminase n=1 Tax=Staphylococcus massiliensis S46 TaxID=1229783 RepID=K9AWV9_9STAP|nr:L-serine ammonia-lyase, iron-sulfur-dependent subunit beta [Staphylococcus massiliensis]EKU45990.1 L-serine dehydratase subunit beta [Staphylococcus massiliensis S46]MCG3399258.1 L-serine ammonia-lyase, iron-sulfur-dependent subunit beta [Staphylococcus massiliensis]MCG3402312.1 L-serine ammonia-lyase, iron-sulfur-dependent subunit beta [Staphylococcus massiliensis]MCG3411719.1 L-serine ammonia-lyase, iron-sulfur-dependent subunit beta [Staphylococcus massiliensis]POA01884.1 L-serine ammoni
MARTKNYQSAFDIIGPVMMGPSSSHTAGAVKIGQSALAVLDAEPESITIHYYESFAETHQGHGTDLAIIGGLLGFSTYDERIKHSFDIAEEKNIPIEIIEEKGTSLGEHPNCALIKIDAGDRHVEVNGISIGGGIIKIKSIHVNQSCILLNHTPPLLVVDGKSDISSVNHLINDLIENNIDINEEIKTMNKDKCLLALHLNKGISEDLLNKIKEKYSRLHFSYIQ